MPCFWAVGPSWAAPHVAGAQRAKLASRRNHRAAGPRRTAHGEAAFEYWVALMVPSGSGAYNQPKGRLSGGHRPPYMYIAKGCFRSGAE